MICAIRAEHWHSQPDAVEGIESEERECFALLYLERKVIQPGVIVVTLRKIANSYERSVKHCNLPLALGELF